MPKKAQKDNLLPLDCGEDPQPILDAINELKGALAVNNALLRQVLDALPKQVGTSDLLP